MSVNQSNQTTSSERALHALLPKLKDLLLKATGESDIREWLNQMGSIVATLDYGRELEIFLDSFMDRQDVQTVRPAFLKHKKLQLHDPDEPSADPSTSPFQAVHPEDDDYPHGQELDDSVTLRHERSVLTEASSSADLDCYWKISPQAQKLDRELFQAVYATLSGSYRSAIKGLRGEDRRYTFAVIALYRQVNLNSTHRIMEAIYNMTHLTYTGDPTKWKLEYTKCVQEIYDSKASLEHLMFYAASWVHSGARTRLASSWTPRIRLESSWVPSGARTRLASSWTPRIRLESSDNRMIW